jgi:hypothetical protein
MVKAAFGEVGLTFASDGLGGGERGRRVLSPHIPMTIAKATKAPTQTKKRRISFRPFGHQKGGGGGVSAPIPPPAPEEVNRKVTVASFPGVTATTAEVD